MSYASKRDDAPAGQQSELAELAPLFDQTVRFVDPADEQSGTEPPLITVERLRAGQPEPRHLEAGRLPFIALPAGRDAIKAEGLVVVAVEGADHEMAAALGRLLNPENTSLALIHVTWLSGIVSSPLDDAGLDDPEPSDLLLYRGAREALVTTADELRAMGFNVHTYLREHRDPAAPIADFSKKAGPALIALGLGRHGAGIGERLLKAISTPVLFVRAR